MELADILAPRAVLYCTAVANKRQLFESMAQRAAELTGLVAQDIAEAIHQRESLGSTGLGNGVAVPHGKLVGLQGVTLLFARLAEPIEFDAMDDQPVDLVAMLLAPVGAGADHLKALSCVARVLRTDATIELIRRTEEEDAIHALLTAPTTQTFAA